MKTRINWKLLIVIILAVTAVGVTGVLLRHYHRNKLAANGYTQGLVAFQEGRWQEAAVCLGQYLAIHQQDINVLHKYAQSNVRIEPPRRESLTQAVNAYRAILRLSDHPQAAGELTQLYLDVDMPAEAELVARRFVEKTADIRFENYLAEALVRQNKFEQAVTVLMQLISRRPDQVLAFDLLGKIAERHPTISRLTPLEWFNQAVEQNPQAAAAYVLRSAYWARQGQLQDAVDDLHRAEQCPLETSDRLSIAGGWIQQGGLKQAQQQLTIARRLEPDNVQVWHISALWAQGTKDPALMLSVAHEAIECLGWQNYGFLPVAGELFVSGGDLERARQCLTLLKQADADRGLILYLEGLIADFQMDWAQAIDRWRQALNLGYLNEPVYLNLAKTLDRIQNRSAAIALLRNYTKNQNGAFQGHLLLGQLFLLDNRFSDAMEQAIAAVQIKPYNVDAQVFYLHCRIVSLTKNRPADWTNLEHRINELIAAHDDIRTRMLLFQAAMKQRDYAVAEEVLQQGQKELGEDLQWVLARADLLKSQGRTEQVQGMLEEAMTRFADDIELVRVLTANCTAEHDYDKAAAVLTQALQSAKSPFDRRRLSLWMAEVEYVRGRTQQAADIYKELADHNPSDIYARRRLLALADQTSDPWQIRQWIEEIHMAEGDTGWQWKYELALYLYTNEDFDTVYPEIVRLLEQNLVSNPDDQDSRILLASAYERVNNMHLALSLYRQALAVRPDDIELIVAAVSLMYRAEEYRQAQQLLDRAIQQGVQDLRLSKFELQNSLRLGRMDAAVSSLERIILETPQDESARLTLALLLIRKGDYEQAASMIEQLMREKPDSASAAAAMADLHLSRSDYDKALAVCDTFLQQHGTIQGHTLRAQVLLQANRVQEALEEIQRIEFLAASTNEKIAVTEMYRSAGNLAKADAMMRTLLAESPDNPAVQKQAALIFLQQPATMEQGRRLLDLALAQNPTDNQLRLEKVRILMFQKTADALGQAMEILDSIIYEMPRFETAWVLLGQGAILQKDPVAATNYIMRGLAILPDSRPLLLLKARAEAMRSPQVAIGTLEELRQQVPDDVTVVQMLSEMYRKTAQPQQAVDLLEQAFEHPRLANEQALEKEWIAATYQCGRKTEAFAFVRKKTELSDGSESFLAAWTGLLVQDGRWKEAVDVYENWAGQYPQKREGILPVILDQLASVESAEAQQAAQHIVQAVLQDNPNSLTAIYSMAMLLHHSGRKLQAIPWYEKTIRLDPGQVIAVNNLAWILATEKGELGQALRLAEEGVRQAPAYVDLIDTRGYVLMRMGRYEQAISEYEKCLRMYIEKSPKRTCSMFYLSRCLMELNKPDEAQISFLRTKRLQEENGGLSIEQQQQLESSIARLTRTEQL